MNNQASQKQTIRNQIRQTMRDLGNETLHAASKAAAKNLTASNHFLRASTIMIFLPIKFEIDARPIALRAWQSAKVVTVPLVSYEQKHMIPVEVRSFDEPMDEDRYGVQTPANATPHPIDEIDLIVVPGLAFDTAGNRLGRGGGFYDRFLAHPDFRGKICGFATEQQIVENVPTDHHDVSMDLIVTDKRTIQVKKRSPRKTG